MYLFRWLKFGLFFLLLLVVGCSGDDEIVGTGVDPDDQQTINAAAHKGPFIIGSNVTINLLSDSGQPTDNTIVTSTKDDLGNFTFHLEQPQLVKIKVDGYHFNEIRGVVSNGPNTLSAVFDTNESNYLFVNILTHLISDRVLSLIANGNLPNVAMEQAQTELINALSGVIPVGSLPSFGQLSVFNLTGTNPTGNAYLLALSATFYKYAELQVSGDSGMLTGKLAETLNTLVNDLGQDGVIDNAQILGGLSEAVTMLNPDEIEENLRNKSLTVTGEVLAVPDINQLIDTDRDGIVNANDNDDDNDTIVDNDDANPYTPNYIPVANAGENQSNALKGETITLDGTASSDADNDNLTYNWFQTGGEPITLINSTSATPSFVAPHVSGDIVIALAVSDGYAVSDESSVTISVANRMPIADAGPNQLNVPQQTNVLLDGSNSYDPDGELLSYNWIQMDGPPVVLNHANTDKPDFTPPVPGDYVFSLAVSDGEDTSVESNVTVSVYEESVAISTASNEVTEYKEVVDATYPTGYKTKLKAVFDEKLSTTILQLVHYEDDGTEISLLIYIRYAQRADTFAVNTQAQVRYTSSINGLSYFFYRGESGSVTIDQYGEVGEAIAGSYNVTATCSGAAPNCQTPDAKQITGSFVLTREDNLRFYSVGSALEPIDLGSAPYLGYQEYTSEGTSNKIVSSAQPSYYQVSVKTTEEYRFELREPTAGLKLAVYDSADFDTPVCESVSTISTIVPCVVTPSSDKLYFTVSVSDSSSEGAWFWIYIFFNSTKDEGTLSEPLDISGQTTYMGQVGANGSYYKIDVTPGSVHHISTNSWFEYSNIMVTDDSAFSNVVCLTRNNSCNISVGPTTTSLYLHVPPTNQASDVYFYEIENWEITEPLYYIELFKTPQAGDYSLCAGMDIFESDGETYVSGLHRVENACSDASLNASVPLESGKTYYIELRDNSGHYAHPVDYYVLRVGLLHYSGALATIMPDPLLNEPANNFPIGSTQIDIDVLHYDSFTSDDSDRDYFKITIP